LNAYPDWKIPAEVIAIIPTADRSKATVKVRVALQTKDSRIVPDMGVRVAFQEQRKAGAERAEPPKGVLVPAAAVLKDGDKDIVFLLREGRAVRRAVSLGGNVGKERQVQAGVNAGDTVIVSPPEGLKDGAPVSTAKQ
jgi:hypothetical protein